MYTTRRRRVPGGWQPLPVVQWADKPKRSLLDEPVPLDQPNMQHRLLREVGVIYPSQGPTGGARGCPYPVAHLKLPRRPRREVGVFYASKAPAGRPRGTRARGNTRLRRMGGEQTLVGASDLGSKLWAGATACWLIRQPNAAQNLPRQPRYAAYPSRGRAAATIDSSGAALISPRVVAANSSRQTGKNKKQWTREATPPSRAPWAARTR